MIERRSASTYRRAIVSNAYEASPFGATVEDADGADAAEPGEAASGAAPITMSRTVSSSVQGRKLTSPKLTLRPSASLSRC